MKIIHYNTRDFPKTLHADQGRGARVITRGTIEQKTLGVTILRTDLLDMNLILISQFIFSSAEAIARVRINLREYV